MKVAIDDRIEVIPKPIVLDFKAIYINYQGTILHINDLMANFDTSKISGLSDLRGISLKSIAFTQLQIRNGFFSYSNFNNCRFNMIKFENCYFQGCNFTNAKLLANTYTQTTFCRADLTNAWIDNIDTKSLSDINFTEIKYIQILKQSLSILFKKSLKNDFSESMKFTMFKGITITGPESIANEKMNEYIFWFQRFNKYIDYFSSKKLMSRISVFIVIMMTKLWRSFSYLIMTSFCFNIIYALIYMLSYMDIKGLASFQNRIAEAFIDAFYFSIITFTTLGFGDISPDDTLLKMIVISEVLFGYTVLGIFVYLLSNKLSRDVM